MICVRFSVIFRNCQPTSHHFTQNWLSQRIFWPFEVEPPEKLRPMFPIQGYIRLIKHQRLWIDTGWSALIAPWHQQSMLLGWCCMISTTAPPETEEINMSPTAWKMSSKWSYQAGGSSKVSSWMLKVSSCHNQAWAKMPEGLRIQDDQPLLFVPTNKNEVSGRGNLSVWDFYVKHVFSMRYDMWCFLFILS